MIYWLENLLDNAKENLREITGEYITELASLGDFNATCQSGTE